MKAASEYIDDWEKHARLGLDADDLQQEITRWPDIDDRAESGSGFLVINNCLNEVCHGFRIPPEEWSRWFDTPISAVKATYRNWLTLRETRGGIR
jgi:hypothetical protein